MDNAQIQQADNFTSTLVLLILLAIFIISAFKWGRYLWQKYVRVSVRSPREQHVIVRQPQPVPEPVRHMSESDAKRAELGAKGGWFTLPFHWQLKYKNLDQLKDYWWWFPFVEEFTHLMIVGATGSGKSMLAYALQVELSHKGQVIILDPHASPDWRMKAVGTGRNYKAIDYAMADLVGLMAARFQEWSTGKKDFEHIYIIMDETPAIRGEIEKSYLTFMKTIVREARKVHMHLIVLTQSDRVESLGISGEGDIREAFTKLLLGSKARQALAADKFWFRYYDEHPHIKYPCVLEHNGYAFPVDTGFVPWLAKEPVKPGCEYPITIPHWSDEPLENSAADTYNDFDTRRDIRRFEAGGLLALPTTQTTSETGYGPDDVKAAAILATTPDIPVRTLARQLFPHSDGSGSYFKKAEKIRRKVAPIIGINSEGTVDVQ